MLHSYIELSTAHLSEAARYLSGDELDALGLLAAPYPFGIFLYVGDETDATYEVGEGAESLLACRRLALAQGAYWIKFDRDAPLTAELPAYLEGM